MMIQHNQDALNREYRNRQEAQAERARLAQSAKQANDGQKQSLGQIGRIVVTIVASLR